MSERAESIDLVYHQFRAEHQPMPVATGFEQLGEIIDVRVRRGLDELYAQANPAEVDYAGFALTRFLFPQQKLEFQYPEAASALKDALVGMDMSVASGPRPNPQDFWIEFGDCFDIRALARQNPNLWRETVSKHDDFVEAGFITGPIVRLRTSELSPADEYNQRSDLLFSTRWSTFIHGRTLLTDMYEVYPQLREGFAIPRGLPHEYLAKAHDLTPKNTSFYDEWLRRRSESS